MQSAKLRPAAGPKVSRGLGASRLPAFAPHALGARPPASSSSFQLNAAGMRRVQAASAASTPVAEGGAPAQAHAPAAAAAADTAGLTPPQLTWPSRSHGAGSLRLEDAGAQVTICGWVDRARDMGGVQFFDVRDHTGLLQVPGACWGLLNLEQCWDLDATGWDAAGQYVQRSAWGLPCAGALAGDGVQPACSPALRGHVQGCSARCWAPSCTELQPSAHMLACTHAHVRR